MQVNKLSFKALVFDPNYEPTPKVKKMYIKAVSQDSHLRQQINLLENVGMDIEVSDRSFILKDTYQAYPVIDAKPEDKKMEIFYKTKNLKGSNNEVLFKDSTREIKSSKDAHRNLQEAVNTGIAHLANAYNGLLQQLPVED